MPVLPYKIACLVYAHNTAGQVLLLKRAKAPNRGLYSPIGGKLEQAIGESPYACAIREIKEEIEVDVGLDEIRLLGIVSECGYVGEAAGEKEHTAHWLMFCFEILRPLDFAAREMEEGWLEWVDAEEVGKLAIPETDRDVIWPLVRQYLSVGGGAGTRGGGEFFSVHIDCAASGGFRVVREH